MTFTDTKVQENIINIGLSFYQRKTPRYTRC